MVANIIRSAHVIASKHFIVKRLPYSSNLIISRSYTLDSFNGSGGPSLGDQGSMNEITGWPIRKYNTILNIVPQGKQYIVERFGKFHIVQPSGYFFAIPFVDEIAYIIDSRERAIQIPPQAAITRDNVTVDVSGNLFLAFDDAERAAYGARNPLFAVIQHAQSAMRSAIGEMELDEILHGRARLNTLIKGSIQESSITWGIDIRRYEITEITPDPVIRQAMDKQAAAERTRREHVLQAEGDKRRAELVSEGVKISLTNESEGNLIKVKNEAEAAKVKLIKEAEGDALSIQFRAQAQAEAIQKVGSELLKPGGLDAAKLALARDYVSMYGEMGKESNTMIFNERPGDVNALLSQAALSLSVGIKNADKLGTGTKDESKVSNGEN